MGFDLGGIADIAAKAIGGMIGGPAGAMFADMALDLFTQAIGAQTSDASGDSGLLAAAQNIFDGNYAAAFNDVFG